MPNSEEINKELLQLLNENEILKQKNMVLEESVKGALQENTMLHIDQNVLKTKIKDLERGKSESSDDSGKKETQILQNRLDFKTQEADDLRKRLNEDNTIIFELEKRIQDVAKVHLELKKKQQELSSLTKVIQSLQAENDEFKKKK